MSRAKELADELIEAVEGFPQPTKLESEAADLLRTQDALLRQAAEALCQLSSVAVGTEHGREFKYQVDSAVEVYGAIKEHLK